MFAADHGSRSADFTGASGVERVGNEAVFRQIDFVQKAGPKSFEFRRFKPALEQAVLDANAKVLAYSRDTGETTGMAYVVSDKCEHLGRAGRMAGVWYPGKGLEPPIVMRVGGHGNYRFSS